ncbi:MAG: tRNA (N(6)-L-threonylcarbamoyladenosine(37)-C(2))-methylthiotransferase MtaB [Candidatus Cloacimonetes bacterium]|nr:tRNA (N(6)-L-threonylcarbamoyladenosine(37)-C(2))-methylthiotransferase MtaB [Candidatus Cloacimonadota bacterium]
MKKIFIETLGCKINQSESACILDEFLQNGFQKAVNMNEADYIIINTCTVTNRTDYKSRNLIKKALNLKSNNSNIKLIITGCYSQRFMDSLINENKDSSLLNSSMVDYIIDNNNKHLIYRIISKSSNYIDFQKAKDFKGFSEMKMNDVSDHSRAFLKIQDGCNFFCSYCAVPYARGNPRSRSVESIKKQIQLLLDNNYSEIVLSGINLGLYNDESNNNYDLSDLINDISKFESLNLIRLSSIEPQLFNQKLFDTIRQQNKICPHYHLPLQTGSDTLLKLHRRRYTVNEFQNTVTKLLEIRPLTALGFDVIVGLPGETDELFEETYNLLKNIDLTYLHIFIYSKRKYTLAAQMPNQVHGKIAKERSKLLVELSHNKKNQYINNLIKHKVTLTGVVETKNDEYYTSTSNRYIKAYFKNKSLTLQGKEFIALSPLEPFKDGILCEVIK